MQERKFYMYTLVIADDEEELRKAIVKMVDWKSIGFEVVGQAENGIEALELVERLEPDLLLTDIKMPFVSGIELARMAREIRPVMDIVFLSGYDDFSYAQQAIQYNIVSYLLKPISSAKLMDEMKKIKEKIDIKYEAFQGKETTANLQERDKQGKTEFLMSLTLDGVEPLENQNIDVELEVEKMAQKYHLKEKHTDTTHYMVLVTKLRDKEKNTVTKKIHVNSVDSVLQKYVRYGSYYSCGKIISIISETERTLNKYINIIVNEIIQSSERFMDRECLVGVSREFSLLVKSNAAFQEALAAMQMTKKGSAANFISDIGNVRMQYEFMEDALAELERTLRLNSKSALEDYFNRLFTDMKNQGATKAEMDLFLIQAMSIVYKVVSTFADTNETMEMMTNFLVTEHIIADKPFEDAQGKLKKICMKAKDIISSQRKQSSATLCDNALKIIKEDFTDENLTLITLSEKLHVSPSYLSGLMKKNKGDTFSNLLTAQRMEKAKEYVLMTSIRVLEIASWCGYSDQHYFSYCFKKYYGMSPNKMRESNKAQGEPDEKE